MTFEQRTDLVAPEHFSELADRPEASRNNCIGTIEYRDAERSERLIVHILAAQEAERAHLARVVFALGHHAEVYSDFEELVKHKPTDGILLVREGIDVTCPGVIQKMDLAGFWLPVIGYCDEFSCDSIVAGVKAGALDFILAPYPAHLLIEKLTSVNTQGKMIRSRRHGSAAAKQAITSLSQRERQVLELLAGGASNKEMARVLAISPRTVEIHRMKMMGKLGAKTAAQAIRMELARAA